jgi:hypothetical protein
MSERVKRDSFYLDFTKAFNLDTHWIGRVAYFIT